MLPLIKKHVLPGSLVYSDMWRAYSQINVDFEHHMVNHSLHFVDPSTGIKDIYLLINEQENGKWTRKTANVELDLNGLSIKLIIESGAEENIMDKVTFEKFKTTFN